MTVWIMLVTVCCMFIACTWNSKWARNKPFPHSAFNSIWLHGLHTFHYEVLPGGILFFFSFFFHILNLWHMEIPSLGVKSELQLLANTTATVMPYSSQICELQHSSQQCQILNPLSEARDQTHILMDTSYIHYHWATTGTPQEVFFRALCCTDISFFVSFLLMRTYPFFFFFFVFCILSF